MDYKKNITFTVVRCVSGCITADKIRNEIKSDLNIFSISDKIEENKMKWKDHVDRIVGNRCTKKIMNYGPIRRIDLGRPHKRWLDDRNQNR